jgi:hypothetical protein
MPNRFGVFFLGVELLKPNELRLLDAGHLRSIPVCVPF